jgi:hypothetical protein
MGFRNASGTFSFTTSWRRLEAERDLARWAVNGDMAALHEELASLYEKMINALEPPTEAP